jgi:hypothetical protein
MKNNLIKKNYTLFQICIWIFFYTSISAQGPSGYIYCAGEDATFTLPAKSHLAYGSNNRFKYLFNQTGTVTFSNDAFGGDPIFGTSKSGYYKLADGSENPTVLIDAFSKLKNHITGTNILSPATLIIISNTIQQNIFVIGDTSTVVLKAFDLVDTYETLKGPIFLNPSTLGGFPNDFGANDGFELVRSIFLVQQGIMDYIYTPQNIQKYRSILIGRKFKTSTHFPGACPAPVDPSLVYTAKINGTMPKEYGKRTAFSSTPARRPTGYYLAPGSLGTVVVPASLVGKGFKILVGAHTFERTGSHPSRRFFRVTNTFPINDTLTEIVNPFGGGIYIITPYQANQGIVNIQLRNVVPAPFFSAKSFDKTTLTNWLETQRNNPAPWADFESDKYMMQVPRSWIYNYADPVKLMADWDNRMDVVSKLLGYPPVRSNTMLYLQIDVDIMFGGYGIGNPQINNTYDPEEVENGNKDHWMLKPGDSFWETEFHEMGHAQLFSNFPGEGEAEVNLLAAAIFNRLYGMNIDTALGNSFDDKPFRTRDQAALNWMVTPNFRAGNPMDISSTTKDEVRYQQRGYAKYVEMAALFGWEVIDSFYKKEQLDFIAQTPSDGLSEVDSRILRFAKTTGVDIRPLIHFWGVQPNDKPLLASRIAAENLLPSKLICDRLVHYKSIIPMNNSQFVQHANAFFGGSVPSGGNPDYGEGWYNVWLPIYNASHGILAQQSMQNIINLYFPGGCPTNIPTTTISVNSPSICKGQSVTLVATGATYYQWSNGSTGNSITVSPDSTTIYTVIGKTAGYASLPISAQVTVNPIPTITVSNATICTGQSATLNATGATNYLWSNGTTGASISISPTVNTTYTVTGTTLGCSSVVNNAQVTVNSIPTVTINNATICAGQSATLNATGATNYLWNNGTTGASISISPTANTTYTVTGTTLGCSSVVNNAQVTVNPIPIVIVNNATICAGQSATLNANGATNYLWSNGTTGASISVNPTANTTYTVTGTTLGCSSVVNNAQVTVNPIPTITVSNATICFGQSATLNATGATNYLWSNGAIGASISVNPTANTTYTVTGTTLGCSSVVNNAQVTVNPIPTVIVNNATICSGQSATLNATGATNYLWSNGATGASISVNPTTNTTYTVTGSKLGCSSVVNNAQVTVNSIPTVTVNNATICAGQSATLNATGATNYLWSNGTTGASISVNPTANTTYTVTGTTLGCSSIVNNAQVTVNPIPTVTVNNATICSGQSATLNATGATNYLWNNGATGASISVNPTANTTYTVTGSTLGCSSVVNNAQVTVNPIPTVIVNNATICAGQSATLNATGATNYLWSNGTTGASISINPTANTTYAVTGTSLGCSSVVNNAQVTVNKSVSDSVLVSGIQLTAFETNANYQWINCNGNIPILAATNRIFLPSITGSYALIVSNGNCSDTSKCISIIMTDVDDLVNKSYFKIFPNPVSDKCNIRFTEKMDNVSINIYNLLGQLMYTKKEIVDESVELDLTEFSNGIYLVSVLVKDKIYTIKLIKEK